MAVKNNSKTKANQFKNKGKQISYQHSVISCQRSAVSLEGDFGLREIDWVGQNPP